MESKESKIEYTFMWIGVIVFFALLGIASYNDGSVIGTAIGFTLLSGLFSWLSWPKDYEHNYWCDFCCGICLGGICVFVFSIPLLLLSALGLLH